MKLAITFKNGDYMEPVYTGIILNGVSLTLETGSGRYSWPMSTIKEIKLYELANKETK